MSISTLDDYIASYKQKIRYLRTGTATVVASNWHTTFNLAGFPGAGSFGYNYGIANPSTVGFVNTNSRAGFPKIQTFGTSQTGYITGFQYGGNLAGRFLLYDRVWESGPHRPNSLAQGGRTITANPSTYEYRVPFKADGVTRDWTNLGIWVDVSVAIAASAVTLAFGYQNECASTNKSWTPQTLTLASFTTGRTFQMPLQAGDKGVIKITDVSISGTPAATGTFNVYLARILYDNARVNIANYSDVHGFEKIGMPIIDASAALAISVSMDSTTSPISDIMIEIASK